MRIAVKSCVVDTDSHMRYCKSLSVTLGNTCMRDASMNVMFCNSAGIMGELKFKGKKTKVRFKIPLTIRDPYTHLFQP
jgi:hypothetical protein